MSPSLTTAAEVIAHELCRDAIWHNGACAWLMPNLTADLRGVEMRATGPDVYEGTAGIGMFLADLSAALDDSAIADVAAGAARHAAMRIGDIDPADALGLHGGRLGVAWALVSIGVTLGDEGLVEQGRELAIETISRRPPLSEHDLVGGKAGGIVALLAIGDLVGEGQWSAAARGLGEDLLAAGRARGGGLSWPATFQATGDLAGLAHGAAGIGWALLELYGAEGDTTWREAALRAFAYERELFDEDELNWPDLRVTGGPSFSCAWCHGAPGIGLSRARAFGLLGTQVMLDEAATAMATTRDRIDAMRRSHGFDFSLCHGLSGNAAALLEATRLIGAVDADARLVADVAEQGVEDYLRPNRPWPCGTHAGEAPGLMIGLAGIGAFFLSLAEGRGPSVLMPRRRVVEPELAMHKRKER